MCQCQTLAQEGAVAVVAEGAKEPVDLEDDEDEDGDDRGGGGRGGLCSAS